jgi:hypothetical protein
VRLYFGGAEMGSHRRLLDEQGVRNVALSYMGLRERNQMKKPWLISEQKVPFPSYMSVFLDSGTHKINNKPDVEPDEIEELAEHYRDFVNANLERVDMVSEFDAIAMGLEWIEEERESFWDRIPREKFMAVWHPSWGLPYLHEMAAKYELIGIPATSLEGRNLRPVLNALAAGGTRIHGVGMTKIEEMQSIRWHSVASTSWTSPQRFGDTIVWTGKELKRYPRKYKEQARKRHRTLFKEYGLNADAIEADDSTEVLRLSLISWQKFEEDINRKRRSGAVVTPLFSHASEPEVETPDEGVDTPDIPEDTDVSTPSASKALARPRNRSEILPVMGLGRAKEDDEDSDPVLNIRSESARVCNTCFLAEKCPGYEPDSTCLYNIPVQIRTREQVKGLRQGMLEMQTQRVMFMRMAEEVEGGYADPNLTKEMALLSKMVAEYEEAEREGFSISIRASGSGQQQAEGGMLSRLFGKDAGQKAMELEAPLDADNYIDAEIIHDSNEDK